MSTKSSSRPSGDHCWRDVIPEDVQRLYSHYRQDASIGPSPALVAIDLYELAYQGGPRPVAEVSKTFPSSCGEYAWAAIEPTRRLIAAARGAGLPVFYSTSDVRPDSGRKSLQTTKRRGLPRDPALFDIRPEFQPQPEDIVIRKWRASVFFGTLLTAHLIRAGVKSLILCGESTSGCLRASAVEAYSHGFDVNVVEECCFDRSLISHKVSLFDLHHKYANVLHAEDVIGQLDALKNQTGTQRGTSR